MKVGDKVECRSDSHSGEVGRILSFSRMSARVDTTGDGRPNFTVRKWNLTVVPEDTFADACQDEDEEEVVASLLPASQLLQRETILWSVLSELQAGKEWRTKDEWMMGLTEALDKASRL